MSRSGKKIKAKLESGKLSSSKKRNVNISINFEKLNKFLLSISFHYLSFLNQLILLS